MQHRCDTGICLCCYDVRGEGRCSEARIRGRGKLPCQRHVNRLDLPGRRFNAVMWAP
ncbi:hypothetical protein MTBLM5_520011 [Magnetospirillum sp. LM-5]|nr:hypothetical protein MTBLM5_520011 [Magnetospirillum sp. LM-5]